MAKKNRPKSKKADREIKEGEVPGTFANQNLGHNARKEGLGPNTDR